MPFGKHWPCGRSGLLYLRVHGEHFCTTVGVIHLVQQTIIMESMVISDVQVDVQVRDRVIGCRELLKRTGDLELLIDHLQRKYRLSEHSLAIEKSRRRQTWLSREDRLCGHCSQNEVETELHFLTSCPMYDHLRRYTFPTDPMDPQ